MTQTKREFIAFAMQAGVLQFGEFVTKAGRLSPYFFNAGLFNDGATLGTLARFYAKTLRHSGVAYDCLFGPAYKGITLASATAVALAQDGCNVPFAFNRKEAKDHGEGGTLVGAAMRGQVVIVDDVISAGTSVRESVALIRAAGATPGAVLIALDRQECGGGTDGNGDAEKTALPPRYSAVQDVEKTFGIPVVSIVTLDDVLDYLSTQAHTPLGEYRAAVARYRQRYGINQPVA